MIQKTDRARNWAPVLAVCCGLVAPSEVMGLEGWAGHTLAGETAIKDGRFDEAKRLFSIALADARKRNWRLREASSLEMFGRACLYSDEPAEAEKAMLEAVRLVDAYPPTPVLAGKLESLGQVYEGSGKSFEAEKTYIRALSVRRATSFDPADCAMCIEGLAEAARRRKDWLTAESLLRECIAILSRSRKATTFYEEKLAGLLAQQERYADAQLVLESALGHARVTVEKIRCLAFSGELFARQKQIQSADARVEKSFALWKQWTEEGRASEWEQEHAARQVALALWRVSERSCRQGEFAVEARLSSKALSMVDRGWGATLREDAERWLAAIGLAYSAAGQWKLAEARFERCLKIYNLEGKSKSPPRSVLLAYAKVLRKLGRTDQAATLAKEAMEGASSPRTRIDSGGKAMK